MSASRLLYSVWLLVLLFLFLIFLSNIYILSSASSDSRRSAASSMERATAKEIYRPVPLCTPILFPTAHALVKLLFIYFVCSHSLE
jgi:hypothetical protein